MVSLGVEMAKRSSQRPFWERRLHKREVSFTFTGEQASALATELLALREKEPLPIRLDDLLHYLTFDADYLKRR